MKFGDMTEFSGIRIVSPEFYGENVLACLLGQFCYLYKICYNCNIFYKEF
jgi:hypothetical protein